MAWLSQPGKERERKEKEKERKGEERKEGDYAVYGSKNAEGGEETVSGVHERRAFMCTTSGAPAKRSRSRKCRNRSTEKVTLIALASKPRAPRCDCASEWSSDS